MKVTLKNSYLSEEVMLRKDHYQNNGALALVSEALDGEPFATLSVNLPESGSLPPDQCFFKNYSENEGFLECCIKAGAVELTGQIANTGFVEVPVVRVLF